jgi:hypothetical protein
MRPSKENGFVTTPTVSAPISWPSSASVGAPPVRRSAPDLGARAGAEAARGLRPDVDLQVGVAHQQRLGVRVHRDELDASDAGVDHPVDGIGAAAADADDLDHCQEVSGLFSHSQVRST